MTSPARRSESAPICGYRLILPPFDGRKVSRTGSQDQAQEKPEPGLHPPGVDGHLVGRTGDPMRMAEVDMCLVTSVLLHSGHSTVSFCWDEVVMTSN